MIWYPDVALLKKKKVMLPCSFSPCGETFLLPARGEEIARGRQIAWAILRSWATDSTGEEQRRPPSFSYPSSFSLPRLIPLEIGRRWSKSTIIGQFWVTMGRKQPQSAVLPDSGRSAYWSTGGPVCTARYGRY
ncbi:hypothetical protein BHE74_00046934 [Ensete ventricosum]|nr:hypothetical protein BHE74_00046934 [Ensete ventricosum]